MCSQLADSARTRTHSQPSTMEYSDDRLRFPGRFPCQITRFGMNSELSLFFNREEALVYMKSNKTVR